MFENKTYKKVEGRNLFKFSSGKFLPIAKRMTSGIPVYGGNGISWYTDETLVSFDTIVIGRVGAYCGNVMLVKGDKWITDNAIYISEFKTKDLKLEFLEKLMESYDFHSFSDSSAQPKITQRPLENQLYIVPPIELQEEYINQIKQIDKSKFLLQQILEKFELLKKSRFIELIGNIQNPKYQLVELNEICEFIKDGTHQTPIYTEDRVNGFKFLSSKDVTSQKINWSNIKYIPKELHEQLYAKLSPKRGDILLAKNGTTGVAAVVDSDEIFDIYVSLALLRPKSGVNVSYLCSALNSEDLKRQFNSSLKGIGVPNLHLREIKKARIIFPPIDIQNKISSITKQIDKSKFNVFQDQTATQVKVIVVLHHIC